MGTSDENDSRSKIGNPERVNPTSRIKLIATDIDGTLLNSQNTIPSANLCEIERALALGVRLALVTARKQASTFAVADALGVPCACISHNGARIWDWERRELRHLVVDRDLARDIARFADRHAIPLILTIDETNFYTESFPLGRAGLRPDEQRVQSAEAALVAPPTRIIAATSDGVSLLHDAFGGEADSVVVHRYYSREGAIASAVLTHPRATKEDALAELLRHTSFVKDEVLALGDAEADAGMLRWAGVGVAMGNAMPEARAAADWIAPDHDHAGFAAALARFV
jgi:5-amino-6-(5-phospho-D-ribitylamino)uracil phosphatase